MAEKSNVGERMARLEEKVDNQSTSLAALHEKFDDFVKTSDTKYAGKWTEEFLKKAIYTIVFAVAAAILAVVIVVPKVSAYFF